MIAGITLTYFHVSPPKFSLQTISMYISLKRCALLPSFHFAIRQLGCKSGVMLTASHNPKEYNGYKAYGSDGGQFVFPEDKAVMDEVAAIKSIDEVKFNRVDANIEELGEDIDELYLDKITQLSVSKDAIKRQKDLKIVYSPIHGTGYYAGAGCIKAVWF